MVARNIPDVKDFTKQLFLGDIFHPFLMTEGTITTYQTITLDGNLHKNFYDEEEQVALGLPDRDFVTWKECQPLCFSIIKGQHRPLYFKFIFHLTRENIEEFLKNSGILMDVDEVFGLFLNVVFDGTAITCTTGTSLKTFTLDKSLDNAWDLWIMQFFKQHGIPMEQLT